MDFFTRASNGWNIARKSVKLLRRNKQLIIFPMLSGLSMTLIWASFLLTDIGSFVWDAEAYSSTPAFLIYLSGFLFYLINYFLVVFFNTSLTYCVGLYFNGEEVSIKKGIDFSLTHIKVIFSWALFAATLGTILRIIQENVGILGKILVAIAGSMFGIATYFVIPIIAYENLGPLDALKRSSKLMKERWGQAMGAGFSFVLSQFIGLIFIAIVAITVGMLFNAYIGLAVGFLGVFFMLAAVSAVRSIFASAVYHNIHGIPVRHFNKIFVRRMFLED